MLAPTGRDSALTCKLLERAGLSSFACGSMDELCTQFEARGCAALLLAEEVFAPSSLDLLMSALARQSAWSDIPMLIFTGAAAGGYGHAGATSPQQLAALGHVILLERPLQPATMVSAARTALRARRRQYEARNELQQQQRAVRARDQFLAMLGHELRNPLAALSLAVNLAGTDGSAQHHAKCRDVMLRQVANLTRLVDDLLDVARVTTGKIVLQARRLDLVALVRRCVDAFAQSLPEGLTLELIAGREPIWVDADQVRLEQVATNLITNAIKYTGAGGSVRVHVACDGDAALLRVVDNGVGLAAETIPRVFELFVQAEGSLDRRQGGMGIGLTLVRSLVELHGGVVQAQSPGLGRGSEFTVRLPRSSEPPATDSASSADGQPGTLVRNEVLVVEDNDDSRELMAAVLRQRGYTVRTAEDGAQGVEEALARPPDMLLVDIGLPELDGYEVARRVRERLGDAVFLIAVTGYGQPGDRLRASASGFDAHMTKPVDLQALEALLARCSRSLTARERERLPAAGS